MWANTSQDFKKDTFRYTQTAIPSLIIGFNVNLKKLGVFKIHFNTNCLLSVSNNDMKWNVGSWLSNLNKLYYNLMKFGRFNRSMMKIEDKNLVGFKVSAKALCISRLRMQENKCARVIASTRVRDDDTWRARGGRAGRLGHSRGTGKSWSTWGSRGAPVYKYFPT